MLYVNIIRIIRILCDPGNGKGILSETTRQTDYVNVTERSTSGDTTFIMVLPQLRVTCCPPSA